jgi:enediyne biosynthesis protein E4
VRLLVALPLLLSCTPVEDTPDEGEPPVITVDPGPAFDVGDEVVCADPVAGMGRYHEVGAERGLTDVPVPPDDPEYPRLGFERMVVAEDVDADGDIDLLFASASGMPRVHLNDGDGRFTALEPVEAGGADEPDLFGLADLNGDRLPDLVGNGFYDGAWTATNLGDGTFAAPTWVPSGVDEKFPISSVALGDLDGDGDIDAVLVTGSEEHDDPSGPPTALLHNDGGALSAAGVLAIDGRGVPSLGTTFTDRDMDGVFEIFQPTTTNDFGLSSAFWHQDGDGWADRAPALGADITLAAMGIDSADLNGDGFFDYCISDVGTPRCLLSLPDGSYVEAEQALGVLAADPMAAGPPTVGWAREFADLDNDGLTDLLQASGFCRSSWDEGWIGYPDLLWRNTSEQGAFTDASAEAGIDLAEDHYGIAAADLDGNGWLDIVTASPTGPPRLYLADCGAEGWLNIELEGSTTNASALGARVELRAGGRTQVQEILGPRGSAQGPSRAHFGLGSADVVDSLVVYWPDGGRTEASNLPVRRMVRARHPEFVEER